MKRAQGFTRRADILIEKREQRRQGNPAMDIESVQKAIDKAVTKDHLKLPTFYEHPSVANNDDRAGSVIRASLQAWLASDEGAAWIKAKNTSGGGS